MLPRTLLSMKWLKLSALWASCLPLCAVAENVLGLKIPVGGPFAVGGSQALGDLKRVIGRLAYRKRCLGVIAKLLAQRFAFEQFADQIRSAVMHTRIVNG